MYNLFLDDIRDPKNMIPGMEVLYKDGMLIHRNNPDNFYYKHDWVVVRSYNEFVDYITKNGLPKLVSFDHDLAPEHYAYMGERTKAKLLAELATKKPDLAADLSRKLKIVEVR